MAPEGGGAVDSVERMKETTPAPTERTVVAKDGTRLSVRTWGVATAEAEARAPLILCDGLGCDGYVWPYLLQRFAGERRIFHMQWRGHGKSEVPADLESVRVAQLVDDAALALDETGVHSGVWLGHSMGVQVCLEGFRRVPERVRGLGLLCGSFERPVDTWHHAFFPGDPAPFGNVFMRKYFTKITSNVIEKWRSLQPFWRMLVASDFALGVTVRGELNPLLLDPDDFRPYMHHLAHMDMRVFARLARDLADHTARDLLPRIDVPTLVVGGGRDRFCPLWISEEMARLIPGSELLPLVQGSHCAPIEEPRIVERHVVKLLERVDGAR